MTSAEDQFVLACENFALAALRLCDFVERQGWPNPGVAQAAAKVRAIHKAYVEDRDG